MLIQHDLSFYQLRLLRDLLLSRIKQLDVEFSSKSENSEVCNDDYLHELNHRLYDFRCLFNALFD